MRKKETLKKKTLYFYFEIRYDIICRKLDILWLLVRYFYIFGSVL